MKSIHTKSNKIDPDSGSLIFDGIETIESEITLIKYNKELFKKNRLE